MKVRGEFGRVRGAIKHLIARFPTHDARIRTVMAAIAFLVTGIAVSLAASSLIATRYDIAFSKALEISLASEIAHALPSELSRSDRDRYRAIFALQKKDKWEEADNLLSELSNPVLRGHMLATRYLSPKYQSSFSELTAWLADNADHPDAYRIYQLALNKKPAGAALNVKIANRPSLKGYGDDSGHMRLRQNALIDNNSWDGRLGARQVWDRVLTQMRSNPREAERTLFSSGTSMQAEEFDVAAWNVAEAYLAGGDAKAAYRLASKAAARSGAIVPALHWTAGMAAWRLSDKAAARPHFAAMADASDLLAPWDAAAANYWAYRALKESGEERKAEDYLENAASFGRTFYGIVARKTLGRDLELDMEPDALTTDELAGLYAIPAVRRAIALVETGEQRLAELELRRLFPDAAKPVRKQLLTLANMLDLPAVQIPMGRTLSRDGRYYDYAIYPIPAWQPRAGFDVDPALIFAFARQESGFNATAKSPVGAMGIMQLMPDTARFMARQSSLFLKSGSLKTDNVALAEPINNVTLGQDYLAHLMEQNYIGDNMFYLVAAYNAGPGKVLEWQKNIHFQDDPLLFMESIPYVETRKYVTQVMTSYWIYSAMLGRSSSSLTLLIKGQWPAYVYERQVADAAPLSFWR